MKRYAFVVIAMAGAVVLAQRPSQEPQQQPPAQQEQGRGRGRGMTPEQREALAKQEALEKETPVLQYETKELPLVVPNHTIGKVPMPTCAPQVTEKLPDLAMRSAMMDDVTLSISMPP